VRCRSGRMVGTEPDTAVWYQCTRPRGHRGSHRIDLGYMTIEWLPQHVREREETAEPMRAHSG